MIDIPVIVATAMKVSKKPKLNQKGKLVYEAVVYFEYPEGFDLLSIRIMDGVTFVPHQDSPRPWLPKGC